jgi:uncharacterized protein (TIGR02284 family)
MTIASELGKATQAMSDAQGPKQVLEQLIAVNIDTRNGLRRAADTLDDDGLGSRFRAMADERDRMASELRSAGSRFDLDASGSITGNLREAWMSLKDAVGGSDHAILETVEEAEDRAVELYEAALGHEMPDEITSLVRRQLTEVKAGHDTVRDLRDARA